MTGVIAVSVHGTRRHVSVDEQSRKSAQHSTATADERDG